MQTILQEASEEFGDAVGVKRRELVNESPAVPIIAVVDDDKSVRESLESLAETAGYETALFASAEEFLQSGHHDDHWACLILDVRLPGMSGVELYRHLTNSSRSIRTIIITAHADPGINAWATKAGVMALLYKPFQPEVLLQAVRRAIML